MFPINVAFLDSLHFSLTNGIFQAQTVATIPKCPSPEILLSCLQDLDVAAHADKIYIHSKIYIYANIRMQSFFVYFWQKYNGRINSELLQLLIYFVHWKVPTPIFLEIHS